MAPSSGNTTTLDFRRKVPKPRLELNDGDRIAVIGGGPAGSFFTYFALGMAEPAWLQPGDDKVIVMNRETADENGIELGDIVTLDLNELGDDDWQVVGFYQVIFGGGFSTDDVFAPLDAVYDATKKYNKGSLLRVRAANNEAAFTEDVRDQLTDIYTRRNMDILFSILKKTCLSILI